DITIVGEDDGAWHSQLKIALLHDIIFFGDELAVFDARSQREPFRDIVPDSPKGVQAPYTLTKRGIGRSISMQLNSTAHSPPSVEAKSGACPNLDIADATYVGMVLSVGPSPITNGQFEPP